MKKVVLLSVMMLLVLAFTASAYAANVGDSWVVNVRAADGTLIGANFTQNGAWASTSAVSSAAGSIGPGLYASTYKGVVGLKEGTYNASLPVNGTYEVFVTWGNGSNRRANIKHVVTHKNGTNAVLIDQSATANTWVSLGSYDFLAGAATVKITNEDLNLSGSMYANSAKFVLTAIEPVPEPSSLLALGTGLIGLVGFVRRRR